MKPCPEPAAFVARILLPTALSLVPVAALGADHETPGTIPLAAAVPAELLRETRATIADPVRNDGMFNHYEVTSPQGSFAVTSTHGLCKLMREVNALEELAALEQTSAFSDSAVTAAKELGDGAKALVTDPGRTLGAAAQGVGKMFRRLGDRMVQGDESSRSEDEAWAQVIGFSKTKREYAYDFGIDVYSNNETLQKYLDQLAWSGYSGDMAFGIVATVATGGLAGVAISFTSYTQALEEAIRDLSPADLRRMTRDRLVGLVINTYLIDLFIRNDHLSPRHHVFIAGALDTMKGVDGLEHLLRRAAAAPSYEVGSDREVQTRLYAYIHNEQPLGRFVPISGHVVAVTQRGAVVAAAATDHVIWTEGLDQLMTAADREMTLAGLGDDRQLWLMGSVSARATEELERMGWTLRTRLIDRTLQKQCNPAVPDLTIEEGA